MAIPIKVKNYLNGKALAAKVKKIKVKGVKRSAKAGKPLVSSGETSCVLQHMAPKMLEMLTVAILNGEELLAGGCAISDLLTHPDC